MCDRHEFNKLPAIGKPHGVEICSVGQAFGIAPEPHALSNFYLDRLGKATDAARLFSVRQMAV